MKLSAQQAEAKEIVGAFLRTDEKRKVVAGYAGTGKTTFSKVLSRGLNEVFNLAYTGKAANVLREKGARNASTTHSAIYKLVSDDHELTPRFELDLDSPIRRADLVIVDEYSMLPAEIIHDLELLAKKVLYLGDPFQLPPVNGTCNLEPDFFMTEVHRQALDSPILKAANDVREGRRLQFQHTSEFIYNRRTAFHADDYEQAEQIIVGYNRTRRDWNFRFRQKLGFEGQELPCAGDKLICIKNNRELGLFNGMIGKADTDAVKTSFEELRLDFDGKRGLKVWDGTFKGRPQPVGRNRALDQFDYGYAITCHKAQGSEFENVLIYNQPIGGDKLERSRWLYTAITRGKKIVKLVEPS